MQAEPEAPTLVLSSECKIEHCEACFSHNFCTKCKESLYLHKGRCYPACPEGSAAANGTMECSSPGKAGTMGAVGRGPRTPGERGGQGKVWGTVQRKLTLQPPSGVFLRTFLSSGPESRERAGGRRSHGVLRARGGDVTPLLSLFSIFPPFLPAQCEMSEWSLWGPCSKKKKLCGFRRGSEERTRRVLHAPGGDHAICSDTKEIRRCTVRRVPCPEGELQPLPPWRCDHLCFLPVVQERASGWGQMGSPQLKTPCCANQCQFLAEPQNSAWWDLETSMSLSFHFFWASRCWHWKGPQRSGGGVEGVSKT